MSAASAFLPLRISFLDSDRERSRTCSPFLTNSLSGFVNAAIPHPAPLVGPPSSNSRDRHLHSSVTTCASPPPLLALGSSASAPPALRCACASPHVLAPCSACRLPRAARVHRPRLYPARAARVRSPGLAMGGGAAVRWEQELLLYYYKSWLLSSYH